MVTNFMLIAQKIPLIHGSHNNWIIINFLDDVTDEEDYENINWTILDGDGINISLIIMEGNYGAIDADGYKFHGYYNIKYSSSPFILQAGLSVDGQVISSGEMVCEGTYFSINIKFHCSFSQNNKSNNKILSLRSIINGNVNLICYDSKGGVPSYLG